jgi:hypothetical protein
LWHLQKFLQYIKYIILKFLHYSPLSPSPHIPGIVSTGITFLYSYSYTQYLLNIHSSSPSYPFIPLPTYRYNLPSPPTLAKDRTCSALLFSDFDFLKKRHFCLFKKLYRKSPCDIFMYVCIITQMVIIIVPTLRSYSEN